MYSTPSLLYLSSELNSELQTESSMDFNLENPLTNTHELHFDTIPSLFLIESDHMPSKDYAKILKEMDFDQSFRREAISSVLRVSCNFDPSLSYLAVNYLDRFLSSQGIPQPKPWVFKLLALACVSLAAKMKEAEFYIADILGDGDPPLREALKARACEIIFKAQNDINLLEFRPSLTAASALLHACHELFPMQFLCFRKAISNCSCVNKESLLRCYDAMQETAMDGYESQFDTVSSSDTPVNVLDRHFSRSESENTGGTAVTISTDGTGKIRAEKGFKRRKISAFCNNQTAQLSQMEQRC
ncbi:hypothetical protein OIU76_023420 [Salix suchowensis]|nr:hypothetical protein OIU76_023420 [Salix suchowensis]